jgi:GNAT superfamily N-acetyltransferase
MSSFIADNGIVSELNRGVFFGHRDQSGLLDGVALIGHTTLVEARSEEALHAFAIAARRSETPIHLIMSSGDDAERFHRYLSPDKPARLVCTELLFEAAYPFAVPECEFEIGNASLDQLLPVAEAQAEIALMECGVDPMKRDREGFLKRVARRIEQDRVFSVFEEGKLIFKADIIAETAHTIYLEGVYVHPEHRGNRLGSRCLASLTLKLFERVEHICLLSNVEFAGAHKAFVRAGYRATDKCVSIFL